MCKKSRKSFTTFCQQNGDDAYNGSSVSSQAYIIILSVVDFYASTTSKIKTVDKMAHTAQQLSTALNK